MAKINSNYNKLPPSYFFLEMGKKVKAFQEKNPEVEILRLGIGNTTEALTSTVIKGLTKGVQKLADVKTYTGYGDEQGDSRLRTALAAYYQKSHINLDPQEIFISDGAKPDCANILSIFSDSSIVAVADPAYPVYVDSSIIAGKKVIYMRCSQENGFISDLPSKKADLIFLCSPNNPTGVVLTKKKLQVFVEYARKTAAVIIFDAAYAEYIQDQDLPKSIYEIPGAKSCAIEINSFSKWAGFTGVRLGWSVVPMDLIVEGEKKGKINSLWNRRQTTMFNGASNIAQEGGLAVLSQAGQKECKKLVDYYMRNSEIIKEGLESMGLKVFGGVNAPYLWVKCPKGLTSWEFFDKLLNDAHVVSTPGSGFGSMGEGYLRLSAFGHRENIKKAVESIKKNLVL
ncbi:LL-diaminopimelate aminotransferase [Candidatus Daviesbacteria bacterium]|nr:LL-diaminopimelate aminotransferase [Candidatus Daviesbacteria bacterium]